MTRVVAAFAAVLALVLSCSSAAAENFETYCAQPGLAAPARQTIIVIDEHHVFAEPGGQHDSRNDAWRKFLGNFVLPSNPAALEQNFQPRERVTVLLARKDGAGVRAVFSGCLPFYSAAERARITANGGMMRRIDDFFGTGDVSSAKRAMDLFRIQLGNAVRAALDPDSLSRSGGYPGDARLASSALISALKQGTIVNAAYGLPRIVLYSDLQRFFGSLSGDSAAARQAGLKEGLAADLNLRGAEFYVVGQSGGGPSHDALEMFLLASHAELAGTSSASALPAFQPGPKTVRRYQGLIQYPENQFPIRIRLATDENGTVVDSWLSVQTSNEQFVPLHGVVVCSADGCVYNGDQVLAQIWNTGRGAGRPPLLAPTLPFGGARTLTLKVWGSHVTGSISDPLIRFEGVKSLKLEFSAPVQTAALF